MVDKMFGFFKKKVTDPNSIESILMDAKAIKKSINFEVLDSAWDIYEHIKINHPEQYDGFDEHILITMKNTWEGISQLIENNGDFSKLKNENNKILLDIRDGHLAYSDLIHVLIDHHDDKREAEYIFEKHPKLHKAIPKQYDNARQVIEVIIEIVKDYQWQIEHFAMNHYGAIEDAIGEEHDNDQVYVMPN